MENIADYVGISTNVMTGVDIWEAIRLTREYGLACESFDCQLIESLD